MKNFFKKYILVLPTKFDHYSFLTMICGMIVIFVPFISCGPSKAEVEAHKRNSEVWNSRTEQWEMQKNGNIYDEPQENNDDIDVRVIDSCEYVIWKDRVHEYGNIIHKGNCRNPIHKNQNQEQ